MTTTSSVSTATIGVETSGQQRRGASARMRVAFWGFVGVMTLVVLWEVYRLFGPAEGVMLGSFRILPRATDLAMPHIWEMIARMADGTTRAPTALPLWLTVLLAMITTLGISAAGWFVGLVVGLGLALVMLRWRIAEWGFLPWIVLSQTVPLIAFAPLVKSWGSKIQIGDFIWQDWMSVALIASYLAFFPIAIGALKGLASPEVIHLELMRTYGVGWWRTLATLRIPASIPYLLPALRLAAANAIVGAVVGEVSTGQQGGLGRLLIQFAGQASADPAKPWAPIFGAVVLGLIAAGSVALLGLILRRYRRTEEPA